MRDAEAGQESEPGREHPGKMSPTGGGVPQTGRVRDVDEVKAWFGSLESRRQD